MDEKKIPLLDVKFDGNAKKTEINVNKIFFKVLSDERIDIYTNEITNVLYRMIKEINEKINKEL
ncbi:hypothetical protein ACSXAL_15000 (plasmid) [Clostridium perfringens]|uniref:hypothetical protein n=1 Tax=Clostridium perfringens TaxID=1502 RepID=UPI001A2522BC|nr:hypothetical protein [Clostridium perfringens]MDM0822090.1 hypothetical protein [Clostridium perfringens]HAT4259244.1 hypothetical protein [Clostridium perfringens]